MRALSFRNPWPWALIFGGKDVENRRWRTNVTGPVLIHAALGCTTLEYTFALAFMNAAGVDISNVPPLRALPRGGIVGVLTFTGETIPPHDDLILQAKPRRWHMPAQYGHVVAGARPLPFIPYTGRQRWFDVPDDLLRRELGDGWESADASDWSCHAFTRDPVAERALGIGAAS